MMRRNTALMLLLTGAMALPLHDAAASTVRSRLVGRADVTTFTDEGAAHAPLVGFRYRLSKVESDTCIQTLTPLYLGKLSGKTQGRATDTDEVEIAAKPGYAVAGINTRAKTGDRLAGIQLLFQKLVENKHLDPSDSYSSEWIGGKGDGRETLLGGDGRLVVGIVGRSDLKPPFKGCVTNLGVLSLTGSEMPESMKQPATPAAPPQKPEPTPLIPAAPSQPTPPKMVRSPAIPPSTARQAPPRSTVETAASGDNKLFNALRAPESMRETAPTSAAAASWPDVLAGVDVAQRGVPGGSFTRAGAAVTGRAPDGDARLTLPLPAGMTLKGGDVLVRLSRIDDAEQGAIHIEIPIGDRRVSAILDGQFGAGLGPIEHQPPDRNGTLVPAARLPANVPVDIVIRATPTGADSVTLQLAINGMFIIRWTGPLDHLQSAASASGISINLDRAAARLETIKLRPTP